MTVTLNPKANTDKASQSAVVSTAVNAVTSNTSGALSLSTPSGALPLVTKGSEITLAIAGDSISEQWNYNIGNSNVMVSPGIMRVGFASAYALGSFWPGDKIKVAAATIREANQMEAYVSSVDAARLWIEYPVVASQEHSVIGAGATVYKKNEISSNNYLAQAFAKARIPYRVVCDAAIGGGDSEQINEVLKRNWVLPDLAIYAPGMNDVFSRNWAFERIQAADIANLSILRQCPQLVILSINPRATINPQWSDAKFTVWKKVNTWRREYARKIGATFIDQGCSSFNGKTYGDPLSVYFNPPNTGVNATTSDGVHPEGLGAVIMGAPVGDYAAKNWEVISDYLPGNASQSSLTEGWLTTNPVMATIGGSTAGTATWQNLAGAGVPEIAENYLLSLTSSTAATVVKTGIIQRVKEVHGDAQGMCQRILIDNSAGPRLTGSFETISFHTALVSGDKVDFGASILVSNFDTPGSGNPVGLTSLGNTFFEQHATATNRNNSSLAASNGVGHIPGLLINPVMFGMQTRPVSTAGVFTKANVNVNFTVAAGGKVCIDIGRLLAKRS